MPLVSGIAELIGLEKVSIPTATGEWDTDYAAKTRAAIVLLEKYDFVGVHLEGPDEASHNFDLGHKVFSLECISELCLRPVVNALKERGEDFRLLFISDHYTYTDTGRTAAKMSPIFSMTAGSIQASKLFRKKTPIRTTQARRLSLWTCFSD